MTVDRISPDPPLEVSQYSDSRTMTDDYISFSAKTCHELLHDNHLSDEQLDYEFNYCRSVLGVDFGYRSPTEKLAKSTKLNCIDKSLVDQVKLDMNVLISKFVKLDMNDLIPRFDNTKSEKIIRTITKLIDKAETLQCALEKSVTHRDYVHLSNNNNTNSDNTESEHTEHRLSPTHTSSNVLPIPVHVYNDVENLKSICIDDLLTNITLERISHRQVAYFGNIDYSYGNVTHRSRPYPDNTYLDKIFSILSEKLDLPEFNKDTYTCLYTLYSDGSEYIPPHQDSERCIDPDSSIINVSFGASRDMLLTSIMGDEVKHTLHSGTVNTMSYLSQFFWSHSIPTSSCTLPRLSLTFRKLVKRDSPPPIRRPLLTPDNPPPPPSCISSSSSVPEPRPRRGLLGTDSIHAGFPVHHPAKDVVYVKKINYELHNLDKCERLFMYFDLVFISCGVNDLARYRKSGRYMADFICDRLRRYSELYPSTCFVFNSILHTDFVGDGWLNDAISLVNEAVFRLSVDTDNLWFFDSHCVYKYSYLDFDVIDYRSQGIHITYAAKLHITPVIVSCITHLLNKSPLTGDHWPLRPEFGHLLSRH